ncbi:hypothetical protein EUEG_05000 [Escherichia coli O104:H4 str. 09-7901]|nr:hypothetical protein EUEG_05000 [Escherichia coli O104:H4 str. 09-7901]
MPSERCVPVYQEALGLRCATSVMTVWRRRTITQRKRAPSCQSVFGKKNSYDLCQILKPKKTLRSSGSFVISRIKEPENSQTVSWILQTLIRGILAPLTIYAVSWPLSTVQVLAHSGFPEFFFEESLIPCLTASVNLPRESWRLNFLRKRVNRMTKNTRFSPEVRQRAVRMVLEKSERI